MLCHFWPKLQSLGRQELAKLARIIRTSSCRPRAVIVTTLVLHLHTFLAYFRKQLNGSFEFLWELNGPYFL
jgi:hypothetical protein